MTAAKVPLSFNAVSISMDAYQHPSRRLCIREADANAVRYIRCENGERGVRFRVVPGASGNDAGVDELEDALHERHRRRIDYQAQARSTGYVMCVAQQTEAGNIRRGVSVCGEHGMRCTIVERRHRVDRLAHVLGLYRTTLERRRQHARP